MSLRTYSLITHPAYLRHVESLRFKSDRYAHTAAAVVPTHRPLIKQCSDIGRYLGISPLIILGVMNNADKHYRNFQFRKKSGGMREIDAPRTYLKVIQWWLLDTILSTTEPSPHAHGFVKGRSFVTNAKIHLGSRFILNVDVQDFFPSISFDQVTNEFLALGYRLGLSRDLAKLTTLNGRLPQGAPTSPALANLILRRVDGELSELATRNSLRFSRYADDITFSSQVRIPQAIVSEVSSILASVGLQLNPSKTRFMGRNQKLEITGLLLGRDGVVLDRRYLNGLRGWFSAARRDPVKFFDHRKIKHTRH